MYPLFSHGRKLQKFFRNASAFSSAAVDVSPRKGLNFAASYLVESLGFTAKLAESISRNVSFEEKGNPDSVLNLFKSHGFTDSQISTIIADYPVLLIADADKSLGPKLQFLKSRGASTSELTEILSKVPKILRGTGDKIVSRHYDFVKEVIEADKKSSTLCLSSLPQGNKLRNVSLLRDLGVPQKRLFRLLGASYSFVYGKERFQESLNKVVEMGFDPTSSKFLGALRFVYGWKEENIQEKINVYKRLGFAVEDVWEMFKMWPLSLTHSEKKVTQTLETLKKCGLTEDEICSVFRSFPQCMGVSEQRILSSFETFLGVGFSRDEFAMILKRYPRCIGLSAETVKKKIEFVVSEMNWSLKTVLSNPSILGYSLEKRTVPRCNVIKTLMSRGLLGNKPPPVSLVLAITNEAFLNKYVRKYDDKELVADLMATFTGKKRQSKS